MIRSLCFYLLLLASTAAPAGTVALVGGTVHPVSSDPIEHATLVMTDGAITALGADVKVPQGAQKVNAAGLHVYPGLIAAYSQLGLVELPSVRATVDTSEAGDFNPNAMAHKAVNPDSELIPVTRSGGVLLALAAPDGGLFSGQSSLIRLGGWTWEDMLVRPGVGMHVRWPATRKRGSEKDTSEASLRRMAQLLDDARAYQAARDADPETPFDIRWEAMGPLLRGEQPLIVDADWLDQIESAVAFCAEQKLRLIIMGGYDAPHCAALLKAHDVPVVVSAIHRLPLRRGDDYDAPYTLPERLRKAGVRYCIAGGGRFASNVRNLPYHAATAAGYGLPRDEALKAITLYPAQILGVDDRVGSLEVGKEATLLICDGDPLETPTHVQRAWLRGEEVDLDDRQKRLHQKFRKRIDNVGQASPVESP
ncbi:imidazolonepropionase [Pirellulimonas nuda]|uniref:Imidazolonepropionase n=1 Tax=Pirellulimonas nuda TaxID=2528009 RepID=A0A518D9C4_9BACT|nr:amidohydrolase family protein [Pirellulimonas nuda]QDU88060.1 imidazolonepropionase [Pirellulimonas nuda]